jgi:hypothetical protein
MDGQRVLIQDAAVRQFVATPFEVDELRDVSIRVCPR